MADRDGESERLSPDEAFAALGNELRIEILRILGEAAGPLAFSEVRSRADVRDSGKFNYHLDKLVGQFVRKTKDGYELRTAGERVVEAVFSGIVTDDPVMEITPIDAECYYCGGGVAVGYRQEQVDLYCTECTGTYGDAHASGEVFVPDEYGWLGGLPLPPAGVEDRTPEEVLRAALTLGQTDFVSMSDGVCPRCAATVDQFVRICDDHDASSGLCPECDRRRGVVYGAECTNCNHSAGGGIVLALLSNTAFLAFTSRHGYNPVAPESVLDFYGVISEYETNVRSRNPLELDLTLTIDGDSFTHTIDGLAVRD